MTRSPHLARHVRVSVSPVAAASKPRNPRSLPYATARLPPSGRCRGIRAPRASRSHSLPYATARHAPARCGIRVPCFSLAALRDGAARPRASLPPAAVTGGPAGPPRGLTAASGMHSAAAAAAPGPGPRPQVSSRGEPRVRLSPAAGGTRRPCRQSRAWHAPALRPQPPGPGLRPCRTGPGAVINSPVTAEPSPCGPVTGPGPAAPRRRGPPSSRRRAASPCNQSLQ